MLDSLVFSVNAVFPIVALVSIGYLLKKSGLTDAPFSVKANKLVFRLFLPIMLFLNVYGIENISDIELGYAVYALLAIVAVFLAAILLSRFVTDKPSRRGVLVQGAFRSNYALIGIPLAGTLFGKTGEVAASVLSAFCVPLFNILAVISLSIFNKDSKKTSVKDVLLGILKNPLIQAIAAGFLALGVRSIFVSYGVEFRLSQIKPLWETLGYLSRVATPLALISLGSQFEFSAVSGMKKEIIFGVVTRCVIVPTLALGIAYIFFKNDFSGAHFATLVAVFATPNAVSSVPMTQEMGGDASLAGQLVVWTTLLSALSIFAGAFVFRLLGVF